MLGRERWDLFACAFSESHCAGHWFWRYLDAQHHDHDAGAPAALRDALMTVYRALDDAVGRILEEAGAETAVVLASHGMAPYVAGYQLLPEVLARLGFGSAPPGGRSWVRDAQNTLKHWVPRRHWEAVGRLVVEHPLARAVLRPLQRSRGAMFFPLESPDTRAVYVPNNTIGAVRLNLRGREPFGRVEPGAGADRVMDEIAAALLELRQPSSGQPIVAGVERSADVFGPGHHPDVPDLIVRFRQDLGLLDTCESARIGRVHVPVGSRWARRSGDHSPRTTVWMTSSELQPGGLRDDGALTDIAPTLLAAVGCDVDARMRGRTLLRG